MEATASPPLVKLGIKWSCCIEMRTSIWLVTIAVGISKKTTSYSRYSFVVCNSRCFFDWMFSQESKLSFFPWKRRHIIVFVATHQWHTLAAAASSSSSRAVTLTWAACSCYDNPPINIVQKKLVQNKTYFFRLQAYIIHRGRRSSMTSHNFGHFPIPFPPA